MFELANYFIGSIKQRDSGLPLRCIRNDDFNILRSITCKLSNFQINTSTNQHINTSAHPQINYFCTVIIIDDTIISDELAEARFCCNLAACKGACCVLGDAGAPLDAEEISSLEDAIDFIKPYMEAGGKEVIEKNGVFDYDADGNFVTPLVNDRECAFVYFKNNIAFCAIEKAWLEKQIDFQKPISCHLYPVRLGKLHDMTAVNYHKWSVCKPAIKKGNELQLPAYIFLKEPLIRKFGEKWFQQLEEALIKKRKKHS